jgi:hypothetical protein
MRRYGGFLVAMLVSAALALPAAAAANPVEGHYTGLTNPGDYTIDFHYRSGVVHDFRFGGHLMVARMEVVHHVFEGRNSAGRLVYGGFNAHGEAVGAIAKPHADHDIAYHWHVKPVR